MNLTPQKSLSEINVTSLVDVTLVLLIIFMITSPLMQMGIQVDLPKAASKAIETKGNLTITIRKDATIMIEDKAIPLAVLPDELAKALKEGKKGILIRADQAVPYGAVIKVLDMTRKSGIQDVGLITELDEKARRR
ncbi:MAG: biopolymer transporter ExbD [Candidatus Eisenbacteria bacterium]